MGAISKENFDLHEAYWLFTTVKNILYKTYWGDIIRDLAFHGSYWAELRFMKYIGRDAKRKLLFNHKKNLVPIRNIGWELNQILFPITYGDGI